MAAFVICMIIIAVAVISSWTGSKHQKRLELLKNASNFEIIDRHERPSMERTWLEKPNVELNLAYVLEVQENGRCLWVAAKFERPPRDLGIVPLVRRFPLCVRD